MFILQSSNQVIRYIFLIVVLLLASVPAGAFENREDLITSSQVDIILDTSENIFVHKDEENHLILSREYSYNQVSLSQNGTLFKYIISYL